MKENTKKNNQGFASQKSRSIDDKFGCGDNCFIDFGRNRILFFTRFC